MNTEKHKKVLLDKERELVQQNKRVLGRAHDQDADTVGDPMDASVADEEQDIEFTEASLGSLALRQVRDALQRIENGTFGKCVADGGPIEENRLKEIPWTPYCLKHQEQIERTAPPKTSTL